MVFEEKDLQSIENKNSSKLKEKKPY